MLSLTLLLLAAPLPSAPRAPQGDPGSGWVELPLPELCIALGGPSALPRLEEGSHLTLPGERRVESAPSAVPSLPVASLTELLQAQARRSGLALELQPTAPPILARGEPAALEAARELIAELDRAARALEIEIEFLEVRGPGPGTAFPERVVSDQILADIPPLFTTTVRSGGRAMWGVRQVRPFVASYGVEVAADSGVAFPRLGSMKLGQTMHVRACRIEGGARIHLDLLHDGSWLKQLVAFDPDTPDLGDIQVPHVMTTQTSFGGVVESGGALVFEFTEFGDEGGDVTKSVWIRARTLPDPTDAAWRVLDLALLEDRVDPLPSRSPGAGLDGSSPGKAPHVVLEALHSSKLAAVLENARRAEGDGPVGRGGWPLLTWAPGLLVAPSQPASAWTELDSLVSAAESARTHTGRLIVHRDNGRLRVPVVSGLPVRIAHGVERPQLLEYDVQIAPETWMPAPRIARAFDGLVIQGQLLAGEVRFLAWRSLHASGETLPRKRVRLASQPLDARGIAVERGLLRAGEDRVVLFEGWPSENVDSIVLETP